MSKILLSIKPQYVQQILEGRKLVEYRKSLPRQTDITHVIIYATAPMSCVIAEFCIIGISSGSPQEVWEKTHKIGGIAYGDYWAYFNGRNVAYALQIGEVTRFVPSRTLAEYGIKRAPQGFVYVR